MQGSSLELENIKKQWQEFITRLLVRFGYIKQSPIDLNDITQLVNSQLPEQFKITIPGGDGELTVKEIDSEILSQKQWLQIELMCDFSTSIKKMVLYKTHLQLILEGSPHFNKVDKTIGLKNVKVSQINLISDQYSFLKDTSLLISQLVPGPIKSILSATVASTMAVLDSTIPGSKSVNDVTRYLNLYSKGSKQLVIDYHRDEIEGKIIQLMEGDSMKYLLDENVFEEKLFAEFGTDIVIEKGQALFVFNR